MSVEQVFITRLREHKDKCIEFLDTPPDKSEFGYGHACGFRAGLRRAEQLFMEVIGEEDDGT